MRLDLAISSHRHKVDSTLQRHHNASSINLALLSRHTTAKDWFVVSQSIRFPAEHCTHDGVWMISQTVVDGNLLWSGSMHCDQCGDQEMDDVGFPPESIRATFLQEYGLWILRVDQAQRTAAIKVIRDSLGLSLGEAVARSAAFPIAYSGTKTEAEWLQGKMQLFKVSCDVRRAE